MKKNYYNSYKLDDKNLNGMYPYPPTEDCDNSYLIGNSLDFTVDPCDSEIKADVTVSSRTSVRVWGQIKDCNGDPVPYACLKLIKETKNGYVGIGHTMSDCLGFYQFDICPCKDGVNFRLLVGKATMGGYEKEVSGNENCKDVCDENLQCECDGPVKPGHCPCSMYK